MQVHIYGVGTTTQTTNSEEESTKLQGSYMNCFSRYIDVCFKIFSNLSSSTYTYSASIELIIGTRSSLFRLYFQFESTHPTCRVCTLTGGDIVFPIYGNELLCYANSFLIREILPICITA